MEESSSFVDLLDGDKSHSPEPQEEPKKEQTVIGDDDEGIDFSQGQDPEKPDAETQDDRLATLQSEVETLRKRLKDTQSAFHQKAELLKQRDELLRQRDESERHEEDDDDWFGEDDRRHRQELDSRITETDRKLADLDSQVADDAKTSNLAAWEAAEGPVRKEHSDYDEIVYDFVGEAVFSEKADPEIKRQYEGLKDKSPKAVYEFGKRIKTYAEIARDPEAYRKKVRDEVYREMKGEETSPVGRRGLNGINSADAPTAEDNDVGESFVNSIF